MVSTQASQVADLGDPAIRESLLQFAASQRDANVTPIAAPGMVQVNVSAKELAELYRINGIHDIANRLDAEGRKETMFAKAGLAWRSPIKLSTFAWVVGGVILLGVAYEGMAYVWDWPRLGLFGSKVPNGMPAGAM